MSGQKIVMLTQQELELVVSCLEACQHPSEEGVMEPEDWLIEVPLRKIKEVMLTE